MKIRPCVVAALTLVLTLLLAPVTSVSATTAGVSGNTSALLIDWDSTTYDWATVAPQYGGVTLNAWNVSDVAAIHAASPTTSVYEYADLASTRSNDCGSSPSGGSPCIVNGVFCPPGVNDAIYHAGGLGFCWTWRNHPNWFLRDSSGKLIVYSGFPDSYMMNYGLAAYQNAWLSAVKSSALAGGWNGVLMDNALSRNNYGTPAKYPTDTATQAAMLSMLKVVGPGLTSAGLTPIANLGYDNLYPSLWSNWLTYTGLMNEFSWFWGDNSPQGPGGWSGWMEAEVQACSAQGKTCFFHIGSRTDPLSQAQIDYSVASYLLYTGGNSYLGYGGDNSGENPQVTLGQPLDSAFQDSNGVWHRDFVNGSVSVDVVNGIGTVTGLP